MKQTLFILFSLIASLSQAITVKEATSINNAVVEGGIFPQTTDAVYAHVNASPTVMSSLIDLGAVPGFYVTMTGTATQFDFWWSVTPTAATFRREYSLNSGGTKWLSKQGRYVKIAVSPANLTYTTGTVFYVLADNPAAGTPSSNPAPASITSQTFPSWTVVSNTSRVITAYTSLNLTSVAGTSGIMRYQVGASNSPTPSMYWDVTGDSTYRAPRNLYNVSTTAFIDEYLTAGTHFNMSPTSALDISVTAQIIIWKLTQVVP